MATQRDELSYPELVEELRGCSLAKQTGTWIAATSDNHSLRIGFDRGRIVKMVFQNLKGPAALSRMTQITGGRCSFTAGAAPASGPDTGLPDTPEILRLLTQGGASDDDQSGDTGIPVGLLKEAIVAEATEVLGPMGPTICEEYFDSATDLGTKAGLNRVLAGVATELGDATRGAAFKQRVMARLATPH